jgi:hypothetical protein
MGNSPIGTADERMEGSATARVTAHSLTENKRKIRMQPSLLERMSECHSEQAPTDIEALAYTTRCLQRC